MRYLFFDDEHRGNLLPLSYTRPLAEFRVGILTIQQKWQKRMPKDAFFAGYLTVPYLQDKYPSQSDDDQFWINSSVCPTKDLIAEILALEMHESLYGDNDLLIAFRSRYFKESINCKALISSLHFTHIKSLSDLFRKNGHELVLDFELLSKGRISQELHSNNQTIGDNIFIEEGAEINCAIINSSTGPVYIGSGAKVLEGSIIRGPFALCDHAQVNIGAKIYGPTTIGPHSKVGGELNNVVIFGYSNKGHDGFLGNSVIGEWCNIGADSNNSNLKNNYAEVRLWNYPNKRFSSTGLMFCGLIMGDHSKCGINTMFNTGTVVGVSANIFGAGFSRNFIPSFSWGGPHGQSTYKLEKAFDVAHKVMSRRGIELDNLEKAILTKVFELSQDFRR